MTGRNLVEVLDAALLLYLPVVVRLADMFPHVHDINFYVGRDEPSALPQCANGIGYHDDVFETASRELLLPLVGATRDIARSCPVTKNRGECLSLSMTRSKHGLIEMRGIISDRLGGVSVRSNIKMLPRLQDYDGPAFLVMPAVLSVNSMLGLPASEGMPDRNNLIPGFLEAGTKGMRDAVKYLLAHDVVLNHQGDEASVLIEWLDNFPSDGQCQPSRMGPVHGMSLSATPARVKLLVPTEETRAAMEVMLNESLNGDVMSVEVFSNLIYSYPASMPIA